MPAGGKSSVTDRHAAPAGTREPTTPQIVVSRTLCEARRRRRRVDRSGTRVKSLGKILQFIRPDKAFDAEATAVLIAAYEKAIGGIESKHLPDIMREVAARRIIAFAAKGKCAPDRLCSVALAAIAKTNARAKPKSNAGSYECVIAAPISDRATP